MKRAFLLAVVSVLGLCTARAETPRCLLKYLSVSGTQYVNLNYYPTPKTTVVMDIRVWDYTPSKVSFFGSWGGDFSFYTRFRAGNKVTLGYSDKEPPEDSTATALDRDNTTYKFELNGTNKVWKGWKGGTLLQSLALPLSGYTANNPVASLPMYLFSVNHNGKAEPIGKYLFYSAQIYEDGVLVRDLVPCWTKDYVVAVYDRKNEVIYRNNGTGSFGEGPRVGSIGDVHLQPKGEGLDDTETIITAMKELGGGDTLYLDAGDFNVSSNITVPAGVILSGAGRDKTTVHFAATSKYAGYLFRPKEESVLKDMTIKGTGAFSSAVDCLGPVFPANSFDYTGQTTLQDLTITGFYHTYENFYDSYSGAAIRSDTPVTIRGCIITNNQTSASGGRAGYSAGIAIRSTSSATLVEKCILRNNKRANGDNLSYAACLVAMGGMFRNCLVADNSHARVPAVYATGSARFENCTFANNTCTGSSDPSLCGACYGSANVVFENCLIAGNKGKTGALTPTNTTSTATFNACTIENSIFRNAAGGDYYVYYGEGVNTGLNEDWMTTATDLAGTARIVEDQVDAGCYENTGALWCRILGASVTSGRAPLKVTFTSGVSGKDRQGLVYHWTFGSETLEGAEYASPTWTFEGGHHTVFLRVTNEAGESWDSEVSIEITANVGVAYVSKTGKAIFPYSTPETGANDIETVLNNDLVGVGSEIRVVPDTYTLAQTLTVAKPVRIVSTGGPDVTKLARSFSGSSEYVKLTVAGAELSGFSFANTSYRCVNVTGGMVTNCVFANSTASASTCDPGGVALYLGNNATVVDCLFTNNTFKYAGGSGRNGGTVYAKGSGILIDRCRFWRNRMGTETMTQDADRRGIALYLTGSGTIRNSLFAEQATHDGKWSRTGADYRTCAAVAVVGSGPIRVENCTLVSNLSEGVDTVGGLYCGDSTAVTVENTLLYGNHDKNGTATDIHVSTADPSKTTQITNLIGIDPIFHNPGAQDWRLRTISPAVNAGTNEDGVRGLKDLRGGARLCGPRVDIGAYENPLPGTMLIMK